MKSIIIKIIRMILSPLSILIYNNQLPSFTKDFSCKRVYMICELPGGAIQWEGQRRRRTQLGNTHPWNRYFNTPLKTKPQTLVEIESFLSRCKYLSDRKTRSQSDFWEPQDEFEKRRTGDCEDHAIWAWRHLHDLGFRARFVLGDCDGWHAWVHIFVNGRVYLLEATQKHKWFPEIKSYDPWWSVEKIGKKKFAFFQHAEYTESKVLDHPQFARVDRG